MASRAVVPLFETVILTALVMLTAALGSTSAAVAAEGTATPETPLLEALAFSPPGTTFVAFSETWHNLSFLHRPSLLYASTLLLFLGLAALCLRALWRARRYRDADVQLALAFAGFSTLVGLGFRGIGEPLIYAVHAVFPLSYLLVAGFASAGWRWKRPLLAAFVLLLVLNNLTFVAEVNRLLHEAEGLGLEYPPD